MESKPQKQLNLDRILKMNKPKLKKDGILAVIGFLTLIGISGYLFIIFSRAIAVISKFISTKGF